MSAHTAPPLHPSFRRLTVRLNLTDLAIQRLPHPATGQERHFDTQLPGFGITVGTKTKTFIVVTGTDRKLTTLGRYPSVSLKTARSEAKRILADPSTAKTSKAYPEAVQSFLAAKKTNTKPATYTKYKYYLERLPFTGPVSNISKRDFSEKLQLWNGKSRAQNACFVVMKTFLNWCYTEDIIDRHPLFKSRAPNVERSRDRVLTDDELTKVWHAADFQPYGYIIRLLILTGARKMEVRTLVHEGEHITFKDTKNGTDHTLPVTPLIRAHLMDDYSFNNWQREKERLDKRCGVYSWTVHDLRRTWATNAIRHGVSSDVVERVLNHKQGGIKAVYQRWQYVPEMAKALLTVENHIKTIVTPRAQPEPCTAPYVGAEHEIVEQTGATGEDLNLDPTPHETGKGGDVSETNPTYTESCGLARV